MSALLAPQPKTGTLTPVELPRLRAVSTRAPIDIPNLKPTVLHAVPAASDTHSIAVEDAHADRLLGILKAGVVIAASTAFAFGLELWLSF